VPHNAAPRVGAGAASGIRLLAIGVVVATLSLPIVAPAPSYDPWAWLLWGREIAHGTLSTAEGPAFKPFPVAATTVLSILGDAAPGAWVLLARIGAAVAVVLGFRVGRRLGGTAAGALAAVAVALCGDFLGFAAAGAETGWTLALALGAVEAWQRERYRLALACGVGCALLRVEAWPFVVAAGAVLWRRRPPDRLLLIASALTVPALWLVPELLGSGDLLRSASRARIPNPGQPATAGFPAGAALLEAAALPLLPLWAGAIAALRVPATWPLLAAGLAWIALGAAMAQLGFSGEERYLLPGAAVVAIAGAAGLVDFVRRPPAFAAVATVLVVAAAAPRLDDLPDIRRDQAYQRGLAADLESVIRAGGGREALLACGRPYVGDLRGPLLAYHLEVEKRRVGFDPRPPGTVFRSRIHPAAAAEPPPVPDFVRRARVGRWELDATC
jgi:hypothetical protein